MLTKEFTYDYNLNTDSLQEVISGGEIENPYIRIDVIERLLVTCLYSYYTMLNHEEFLQPLE